MGGWRGSVCKHWRCLRAVIDVIGSSCLGNIVIFCSLPFLRLSFPLMNAGRV